MKNLGKILYIARYANRLSRKQAASISGVSEIYISELEKGVKTNISEEYLAKFLNAYGLKKTQIKELGDYYNSINLGEDRKFRQTLIKTLEMIESNFDQ